ncbi:hypothetical protein F5141DRAFT_1120072 [Pisolithus sp. B1]|nr:hypothetical protein F5141DRAFT_1120072 [Pisolithus sp. B1]
MRFLKLGVVILIRALSARPFRSFRDASVCLIGAVWHISISEYLISPMGAKVLNRLVRSRVVTEGNSHRLPMA